MYKIKKKIIIKKYYKMNKDSQNKSFGVLETFLPE